MEWTWADSFQRAGDLKKRESDISVSSGKPRYKIVIAGKRRTSPFAFIITLKF